MTTYVPADEFKLGLKVQILEVVKLSSSIMEEVGE